MSNQRRGKDADIPMEAAVREILSRSRRTETRLTAFMGAMGVGTPSQHPQFYPEEPGLPPRMEIPSPHTSLKDIVDRIPETCHEPVTVFVGADRIATVSIKPPPDEA